MKHFPSDVPTPYTPAETTLEIEPGKFKHLGSINSGRAYWDRYLGENAGVAFIIHFRTGNDNGSWMTAVRAVLSPAQVREVRDELSAYLRSRVYLEPDYEPFVPETDTQAIVRVDSESTQ